MQFLLLEKFGSFLVLCSVLMLELTPNYLNEHDHWFSFFFLLFSVSQFQATKIGCLFYFEFNIVPKQSSGMYLFIFSFENGSLEKTKSFYSQKCKTKRETLLEKWATSTRKGQTKLENEANIEEKRTKTERQASNVMNVNLDFLSRNRWSIRSQMKKKTDEWSVVKIRNKTPYPRIFFRIIPTFADLLSFSFFSFFDPFIWTIQMNK